MDFTLKKYRILLETILKKKYPIFRVIDFLEETKREKLEPFVILRHDVDKKPENALSMATMENMLGVKSTYYFRTTQDVYREEIIKEICRMGHEIGYHYEVLVKSKGNFNRAIELFRIELDKFKRIVNIKTICMHGSPLSKWTDKDLWERYDYTDYGIVGDAFLSIDFKEIAYFTDTGRRWDGDKYNIKDKVNSTQSFQVKTTDELISLFRNEHPLRAMINVHPQRWNATLDERICRTECQKCWEMDVENMEMKNG